MLLTSTSRTSPVSMVRMIPASIWLFLTFIAGDDGVRQEYEHKAERALERDYEPPIPRQAFEKIFSLPMPNVEHPHRAGSETRGKLNLTFLLESFPRKCNMEC